MKVNSRCAWAKHPLEVAYHDFEWGVPVSEDNKHFEFIVLDTFQAGLSWLTILKKREHFRKAFQDFNPVEIAGFGQKEIDGLLHNENIIRNRIKIEATINNAARFMEVQNDFGSFNRYVWDFVDGKTIQNQWTSSADIPATSELSDRLSKDLKSRGFKFAGSTICYAYLQAAGLVNDHETSCFRYREVQG